MRPILTGISAFGCTSRRTSRAPCLYSSSTRMTFMPPPVEPAQPPMKLEKISRTGSNPGHAAKFVVVNPVVVAMETTWNSPLMKVSWSVSYCALMNR